MQGYFNGQYIYSWDGGIKFQINKRKENKTQQIQTHYEEEEEEHYSMKT